MMVQPTLSILLTSWNTRDETRRCLESLHDAIGDAVDYEVVAVDNASRDGSAELLAADPRVRLIRNLRNVGFAPAMNQAYHASTGDLVLLLNSDVRFHPGTLDAMLVFLRDRPDAAGVSPLYLNPDGTFQQHYVQQPSFAAALALFTTLRHAPGFRSALHRFEMRGEDFTQPRELASGSCQLIRRDALGPGDLFDETFPIYWNDAVLDRRLRAAGQRLWLLPDAPVTHTRGASCRLLGPATRFRHLLGGLVGYLRLTQPRYRIGIFRVVVFADYLVRTVVGRSTILGLRDLRAALRGDVGPVPDGDTRDWLVLIGATEGLTPAASKDDETRVIVADAPRSGIRWRFSVEPTGPARWHASLPQVLPFGRRVAAVRWLNGRVAAATLRRWLDRHAGVRILRVDAENRHLVGWLGEDVVVAVDPTPRPREELTRA